VIMASLALYGGRWYIRELYFDDNSTTKILQLILNHYLSHNTLDARTRLAFPQCRSKKH